MSFTKIKLKSGPVVNFSNNLGNDTREPVWSTDNMYNRLFVTSGTASYPTLVNPVVKYEEKSSSGFPWNNTTISEDGYIEYPLLLSSNVSEYGTPTEAIADYTFDENAIEINLGTLSNDTWSVFLWNIRRGSTTYESNLESISQGQTSLIINDIQFAPYYSSFGELYDDVSGGNAMVEIILTTTLGKKYHLPISTGTHDASSYFETSVENNVGSSTPGHDSMGVSFSDSIMNRRRMLYKDTSYFHNYDDNVDGLEANRVGAVIYNVIEENLRIGNGQSFGSLTLQLPQSNGDISEITLYPSPELYKAPSNPINCALPFGSGQIPVLSQGNTNHGQFVTLSDGGCRLYGMPNPSPGTSGALTCTNIGGTMSFSWSNVSGNDILSISYSNLKSLFDGGTLQKGQFYRINDYETTTIQPNTHAEKHLFDLIVIATSETTLDCHAMAVPRANIHYFDNSDLSKWQIWYDINNDTTKYAWAKSAENGGTGVIYRMIDEWGNDCPYDFKNIQFKRKLTDGALDITSGRDEWVYTFNAWDEDNSGCEDLSVLTMVEQIDDGFNYCVNNHMDSLSYYDLGGPRRLNDNVFLNIYSISNYTYSICSYNDFGKECLSNTFGNNCTSNKLGNICTGNIFGDYCSYNTLGNYCQNNNISGNFLFNTLGIDCTSNTFGGGCSHNNFGVGCSGNNLGNSCSSNTFGNSCIHIDFGNSQNNGGSYISNVTIENGNRYIRLYQTAGTAIQNNLLQNIKIMQGCSGNSLSYNEISQIARNNGFCTFVGKDSNGNTIIWNPADMTLPNSQ